MTEKTPTTISKGTYHLFVGNISSTVLFSLTAIIVGRLLGPAQYGLYTIALIVPGYVYLIIQLGLPSALTRFVARYRSEGDERKPLAFSYTIMLFALLIAVLAVALLTPFSSLISSRLLNRPELTGIIVPVAMLSIIGQVLLANSAATFLGLNRFDKSAIFQVIQSVVKLVASVSLVFAGFSVVGAVIGYTAGFLVAGMISFVLLVAMNKSLIPTYWTKDISVTLRYSSPIYFALLLTGFVGPFQSTLLANTVSNTEIGWYSAATNITALIALFTYPVSTALLPLFSRIPKGETQQLVETYKLTVKYSALFIIPVTMLVMSLSTPLASAIFGHAYRSSGNYLLILAIGNLLAGLGNISWSPLLYGVGETRKAFLATAIGSVISILASISLVLYVGVYGVIIGTLLGQTVSLLIGSRFVSAILGQKLQTWLLWRIYLSSALSAILVFLVSLIISNAFLAVLVGIAVFLFSNIIGK